MPSHYDDRERARAKLMHKAWETYTKLRDLAALQLSDEAKRAEVPAILHASAKTIEERSAIFRILDEQAGRFGYGEWFMYLRQVRNNPEGRLFDAIRGEGDFSAVAKRRAAALKGAGTRKARQLDDAAIKDATGFEPRAYR